MKKHLNGEDLKLFIEKYGNGDVYFCHEHLENGMLQVKFLPGILNHTEPENIPDLLVYLKERPFTAERYLKAIILTDNYAYLPDDKRSNKNRLVKNYKKFLEDLEKQQLTKESRDFER